jgi:hypothetical protein
MPGSHPSQPHREGWERLKPEPADGTHMKNQQHLGAPFMQSYRMSGHSRKARTVFSPNP